MSNSQTMGMRGVYAVAAELSRNNFVASITSRSAAGVDILVTNNNRKKSFSVEVKTGKPRRSWLIKEVFVSISHIYVFVTFNDKEDETEFYVVPSIAAEKVHHIRETVLASIFKEDVSQYRDKWLDAFE